MSHSKSAMAPGEPYDALLKGTSAIDMCMGELSSTTTNTQIFPASWGLNQEPFSIKPKALTCRHSLVLTNVLLSGFSMILAPT